MVSSQKSNIFKSVVLGKSLKNMRNKIGPKMLPCDTPLSISNGSESKRPNLTNWDLSVIYDSNQLSILSWMPNLRRWGIRWRPIFKKRTKDRIWIDIWMAGWIDTYTYLLEFGCLKYFVYLLYWYYIPINLEWSNCIYTYIRDVEWIRIHFRGIK